MNPYTEEIEALQRECKKPSSEIPQWQIKLAWFQRFNLEQANFEFRSAERLEASAQAKLQTAQQSLANLASLVKQLNLEAGMGVDPRHWFSSERAVSRRRLASARKELVAQQSSVANLSKEILSAADLGRKIHGEITAVRAFDPLLAQSTIVALQAILDRIEPRLASLRQRSEDFENLLREPVESLRKQESQRATLIREISSAEDFDTALTNAPNSYEKHQLHTKCELEFGEGSPGNVLRQRRAALRRVDDNIRKLRSRVDSLTRFATWDIRHIVIDGNNLCYESGRFLGLVALDILVPVLAQKYKVTLIFDASIRRKLQLRSNDIEVRFPQAARVHIVASKRKADETILAAAGDDPHTFVLSNDRFIEFPEKMAVKEDRMLRHEILDQVVHIHDLQIAANFEVKLDPEAA